MVRIAIMGDLHYHTIGEGNEALRNAHSTFYSSYLHEFFNSDCDYYISIGDLTHFGTDSEFNEIYSTIKRYESKFHHVLGNHDVISQPKSKVSLLTEQLSSYSALELKEANLLFLDSTKEMNPTDWGGMIDETQLSWLETQVNHSGSKPLLIFSHHPVYNTTLFSDTEKMSIDPDTDVMSVLKKKAGYGLFFNGHNHANSVVKREQWHFVQTAAVLCSPLFRILEITEETINLETVIMSNLAKEKEIVVESLEGFMPIEESISIGSLNDQSLSLQLRNEFVKE